jgi:hypothetical protein
MDYPVFKLNDPESVERARMLHTNSGTEVVGEILGIFILCHMSTHLETIQLI